ncbi:MAG: ABC transporter permease [Chloroflexales bacterium]|nr:ABC transporter permease [Chloroflexales bacterium]
MFWYIIRRLIQIIFTFLLLLTISYFLLEAMPGDFAQAFLENPNLTAAQRDALREIYGLDKPLGERFLSYMGALLTGNLGISFQYYPRPVIEVIMERAPRTLVLFLTSTVISFYVGFFAGKLLAWQRGKALEYTATLGGVTLYTVFTPWFGLLMIWLFAFSLKWFPIGQFVTPVLWRRAPVEANVVFGRMLLTALVLSLIIFGLMLITRRLTQRNRVVLRWGGVTLLLAGAIGAWGASELGPYALNILHHMVLPILTVTLISFAGLMLLTRNSMLETLREDYVMAARAKGLPERVIRDKHAARNAMLPVVTALVFALATALGGGIITETVFSWPGMGLTLLEAARVQDIPMTMGGIAFIGLLSLLAHLVADILYLFLDPRIRYA